MQHWVVRIICRARNLSSIFPYSLIFLSEGEIKSRFIWIKQIDILVKEYPPCLLLGGTYMLGEMPFTSIQKHKVSKTVVLQEADDNMVVQMRLSRN